MMSGEFKSFFFDSMISMNYSLVYGSLDFMRSSFSARMWLKLSDYSI